MPLRVTIEHKIKVSKQIEMVDKEGGGNKETASVNTGGSGCNTSLTYLYIFFFRDYGRGDFKKGFKRRK